MQEEEKTSLAYDILKDMKKANITLKVLLGISILVNIAIALILR